MAGIPKTAGMTMISGSAMRCREVEQVGVGEITLYGKLSPKVATTQPELCARVAPVSRVASAPHPAGLRTMASQQPLHPRRDRRFWRAASIDVALDRRAQSGEIIAPSASRNE